MQLMPYHSFESNNNTYNFQRIVIGQTGQTVLRLAELEQKLEGRLLLDLNFLKAHVLAKKLKLLVVIWESVQVNSNFIIGITGS